MSTEPTGLGKTYVDATKRDYINIKFTPLSWCTYEGKCRVADLMFNDHNKACFMCKWREPLDIPSILDEEVAAGKEG